MFCYSWKVCPHCHAQRHCEDTLGLFVCIVLWMLIRTRKIVTSSVIRPGIISGFTRKLKIEAGIKMKWDSRPAERGTQEALSVLSTQFKTETRTKINWIPEEKKTSFFQTNLSNFQSRQVIFHCTRYLIVCDLFHPLCGQKKGIRVMTHTRCWPDPTDHDKQARGEVVGDHVEGHLPGQHQLEPGGAVIHPDGLVVGVAWVQGLEGDLVIQDGLDAIVIRNKLKAILYCIVLDIKRKSYLRQEGNFTHWIVETPNFKLADLKIEE